MAPTRMLLLRELIKELRLINPKGQRIQEAVSYKYIFDQFRKYQVTDQKICKGEREMKYLAQSYLSYLQSTRKYKELCDEYHGKGERSIEETAKLVGFELPRLYNNPETQK